ncbi:hypothetical protein ACU4GI_40155 [Cupriavidus basilensis]
MEINPTAHSLGLRGVIITTSAAMAATAAGPPMALNAAAPAAISAALPLIGSDIQTPRNEKARSRRALKKPPGGGYCAKALVMQIARSNSSQTEGMPWFYWASTGSQQSVSKEEVP